MISMKNNAGRKLPIPERRHQEPVTNPLAAVGDLAIPEFLDAKKRVLASASAPATGPLSKLATTLSGGASAPSPSSSNQTTEKTMKIASTAKTTAKRPQTKTTATPTTARRTLSKDDKKTSGSKLEMIAMMLKRAGGCTTKEVLKATGWPSVSMPQQAKAAGLKLKKVKVEGVFRYSTG